VGPLDLYLDLAWEPKDLDLGPVDLDLELGTLDLTTSLLYSVEFVEFSKIAWVFMGSGNTEVNTKASKKIETRASLEICLY
jgi:hypothetical protein